MSVALFTLGAVFTHTARFLLFVVKLFPKFFFSLLIISLVVLGLEYLATSLMIPLAGSGAASGAVADFWSQVAQFVGAEAGIRIYLWMFFVLMSARLVLGYVHTVASTVLGKRVHRLLSERVFRHVIAGEPLGQIYSRSIGHYITLAGDDTFRCGTIITSLLQISVGTLTACIAMLVLYQFSSTYFWSVTLFLGGCALIIGLILRRLVRLTVSSNLLSRQLNTAFIESMNSIRSIRALSGEFIVTSRYSDQLARYVGKLVQIDSLRVGVRILPAVVLLLAATWLTRPGAEMSVSETSLFAATVIVIRVFTALGQVIAACMMLVTDLRALHDIDAVIGIGQDILLPPAQQGPRPVERIMTLELHNIDFAYPGRSLIFQGVDFSFEAGRTYAVVGPSGSGKSTLADLLLGLVDPQRGELRVNGLPQVATSIQDRVLLVEQQPRIFSTTVRDNLLFGMDASDEALWDALELVGLAQDVRDMPDCLDTMLTYQGENFSGGQRQRIGVARALLRNPEVLVLDEATSALDSATREVLLANVIKRMRDGIVLFITHDPTITARADVIVDLERAEM
jgi:ABC-type bacteriocin/lantibiotic exporter with double-glycine peptidase domain